MSTIQSVCTSIKSECKSLIDVVYFDHQPDPSASFDDITLSETDRDELATAAAINEINKTSRGNGKGNQVLSCNNMKAFAEAPTVSISTKSLEIVQQYNPGIAFAPNQISTWIKRSKPDHIRRGLCTFVDSDTFNVNLNSAQPILAVPMKVNLKPDWDPSGCNFLTGQKMDCFYASTKLWSTKAYFTGSMITPLQDPRQITIIILTGIGVIQTSFGLLKYIPGDLIQIPPNCPFTFYVQKSINNNICSTINYFSKEDIVFPDKQLNVSDLNQIPFSPASVIQCKYPLNESCKIKYRPEYVRVEQYGGNYSTYYYGKAQTPFNWNKFVHQGPVLHKVNLITSYERIGTSFGHKDPNIWLILKHSLDPMFGIAFITGKSFMEIDVTNNGQITYPPAFLHINGVHEKGETILFGDTKGGYDARAGFNEGDCLLHPGGVGHGGDKGVLKDYINRGVVKYILNDLNILKKLINDNQYKLLLNMDESIRNQRINEFIKGMYAFDNKLKFEYNDNDLNVEYIIKKYVNGAVDIILNQNVCLNQDKFQLLGMPFGIGYLMVECRDAPLIPACTENSNFRKIKGVQYGIAVDELIDVTNSYLKKITNKNFIKSNL